jgi:hypothetical protein
MTAGIRKEGKNARAGGMSGSPSGASRHFFVKRLTAD